MARFWQSIVVIGLIFFDIVLARKSVPVVIASHKLVRGCKQELSHLNSAPHGSSEVTNLIKRVVTDCSSDAYILVDIPGLRAEDMNMEREDSWQSLRRYLAMASTAIGLPWVTHTIDLVYIEKYVMKTCAAEPMVVFEDDEGTEDYIDTTKRVIRLALSPLPALEDEEERDLKIRKYDDLIHKVIRKLPTPHYTIIVTSSTPESVYPLPEAVISSDPDRFDIFNDIINDPSRAKEIERNNQFLHERPTSSPPRHTNIRYLRNRKNAQVHLFDADLWERNKKLVATLVAMIFSLLSLQLIPSIKAFMLPSSKTLPKSQKKSQKKTL